MKGLNKILYVIIGLLSVLIMVSLYAKTSLYVTITYNTNGGSKIESKKIVRREKIGELPTPTKEGYTFVNWVIDNEVIDENYIVKENIVIVAIYEKDKEEEPLVEPELKLYTIKYDTDGGSKIGDYTVVEGEKAKKPESPIKEGYEFKEWTLGGKSYNFDEVVTKDITLKATYIKDEVKTYTVTFDTDGGSKIEKKVVEENTVVVKPVNPKKEGYTFKEWTLDGTTYNFSAKVVKDITLVAVYEKDSVKDETSPVLNLKGDAEITMTVGTDFEDPGYTAIDDVDGDITDKVIRSGAIDVSKAGSYTIAYTVQDSAGNSTTKTRTIIYNEE